MFGNLDVWAKHRRSSLISMSGPFLHCLPHSTAILNGCRGLFQLHINCAMDVLRLLIQSLLVQVQRCTNKVKQPSVLVQIWKWFSHFYMIWNMKNKLYWPKPAPFTVYPDHSTKPGKLRSATPAPLTSRSHVRFSKLLLRSFLIQAGTRQMHSNIHEQHLPSSSRWILSTKKMQSRSALSGSLWREPRDSVKAGNLCWIRSDYAEPVRHLRNTGNFRVSCGIHPPVWQHFRYLSFTSLQTMKCLNFCYSLKNMQKPQYWLCMPRNKNLHAVTQSHNNNLKFTSSKNQGKKSHSMSGKLVTQLPAEMHASTCKDKT